MVKTLNSRLRIFRHVSYEPEIVQLAAQFTEGLARKVCTGRWGEGSEAGAKKSLPPPGASGTAADRNAFNASYIYSRALQTELNRSSRNSFGRARPGEFSFFNRRDDSLLPD